MTAQPEDHVDCTQILGDVEAYEGPTQLNERGGGGDARRPRADAQRHGRAAAAAAPLLVHFAVVDAAAARNNTGRCRRPGRRRDVLATAPVQRQLSDASRHATAGDTAPPEPIDLTQDEDTEVEPSQPRAAAPAPAPAPAKSPTEVDPAADPPMTTPSRTTTMMKMARSRRQVEAPAAPPPSEDDPIGVEDADAVDAILDAGRRARRTRMAPAARTRGRPRRHAPRRPAARRLVDVGGRAARRRRSDFPTQHRRGIAGRRDRKLYTIAASAPAARPSATGDTMDVDKRPRPPAGSAAAPMDVDEAAEAPPRRHRRPAHHSRTAPRPSRARAVQAASPRPAPAKAQGKSPATATVLYDDAAQSQPARQVPQKEARSRATAEPCRLPREPSQAAESSSSARTSPLRRSPRGRAPGSTTGAPRAPVQRSR